EELSGLGHDVRTFEYRKNNPLYKNRGTKGAYQALLIRSLERACLAWQPNLVLVIKGGPITAALIARVKRKVDALFLNFFPDNPRVRAIAGPAVFGHDKLLVYAASTLSLNHHHPMNDIVGVNTRTFELAAAGACQVVDLKDDLLDLFKPGEEIVGYRDLGELRRQLDVHLEHP